MKKIVKVCLATFRYFYLSDCLSKAASLAYTTLLSLIPLAAVGFAVLSMLPVYRDIAVRVQSFIFAHIVAGSAELVQNYLMSFTANAVKLSALGMLALLVSAILIVFSVEQSFNSIWQIKKNRHGLIAFFVYWAMIIIMPMVVASLFILSAYFTKVLGDAGKMGVALLITFKVIMPYLIAFLVFMFLYSFLPNRRVTFKSSLIAALIATTLFELARQLFSYYIVYVANYQLIYGALAAVPIFLLWLYLSWLIVLFGVVVSYILEQRQ